MIASLVIFGCWLATMVAATMSARHAMQIAQSQYDAEQVADANGFAVGAWGVVMVSFRLRRGIAPRSPCLFHPRDTSFRGATGVDVAVVGSA
jgi:hypothetical protein